MSEITREEYHQLVARMNRVLSEMEGDARMHRPGYGERLFSLEKDVADLKLFKQKIIAYSAGSAATGTFIIQLVFHVL